MASIERRAPPEVSRSSRCAPGTGTLRELRRVFLRRPYRILRLVPCEFAAGLRIPAALGQDALFNVVMIEGHDASKGRVRFSVLALARRSSSGLGRADVGGKGRLQSVV